MFPAEFADYSATGTNVAEQLTNFGFKISPRAVTYTQVGPDVDAGKFQMVIQGWGTPNEKITNKVLTLELNKEMHAITTVELK